MDLGVAIMWTLVTGGAKRLGAEMCRTLAAKGHSILIHYHTSNQQAEQVVEECLALGVNAACICGNFSSRKGTEIFAQEVLKRYPQVRFLINNVGNYIIKKGTETSIDDWYDLFETNVHAPFILSRAFIPSIKESRGAIINIGTTGIDHIHGDSYSTAYSCTKMALLMLTRSLAKELAPSLVRVNMVSPGYMSTAVDLPEDVSTLPMHRAAIPPEVAQVVAFLLEDSKSYITGQNIEVAGGLNL